MQIPDDVPGLRWLTIVMGLYALVWISLEGALWQVIVMGFGTTLVGIGHLWRRWLAGRRVPVGVWLGTTAVTGLLLGSGGGVLALVFMAVKTGLHAHGPEFTAGEIIWVWSRLPLWGLIGLLVGTAVGFLSAGISRDGHTTT